MSSIYGLELDGDGPGPDDLVHSAIVVTEVLAEDGPHLCLQTSEPMTMWQQLGLLRAAILSVEKELLDSWEDG